MFLCLHMLIHPNHYSPSHGLNHKFLSFWTGAQFDWNSASRHQTSGRDGRVQISKSLHKCCKSAIWPFDEKKKSVQIQDNPIPTNQNANKHIIACTVSHRDCSGSFDNWFDPENFKKKHIQKTSEKLQRLLWPCKDYTKQGYKKRFLRYMCNWKNFVSFEKKHVDFLPGNFISGPFSNFNKISNPLAPNCCILSVVKVQAASWGSFEATQMTPLLCRFA